MSDYAERPWPESPTIRLIIVTALLVLCAFIVGLATGVIVA